MRGADEVVVRVIAGIHCAHAIQLAHLDRREQVVYGERVVGMARQDFLEILNRRIVVEVVVVVEGGLVQRVGRTVYGRSRGVRCQTNLYQAKLGENQQEDGGQNRATPGKEEKHAHSVYLF